MRGGGGDSMIIHHLKVYKNVYGLYAPTEENPCIGLFQEPHHPQIPRMMRQTREKNTFFHILLNAPLPPAIITPYSNLTHMETLYHPLNLTFVDRTIFSMKK